MARKGTVTPSTLAGALVLTEADVRNSYTLTIDPGGAARNVDLPATTNLEGHEFVIINTADAAETLTVRLTGGGATVATIDQSEHAVLRCYSSTAGAWVGAVSKAT